MKNFFDEYGNVLLAVLVVVAMIVIATVLKDQIAGYLTNLVSSFGSKGEGWSNAIDNTVKFAG